MDGELLSVLVDIRLPDVGGGPLGPSRRRVACCMRRLEGEERGGGIAGLVIDRAADGARIGDAGVDGVDGLHTRAAKGA